MFSKPLLMILVCVLYANRCQGDVGTARFNRYNRARLQRQQTSADQPYPAAGFRPNRQFDLPNEQQQPQPQPQPQQQAARNGEANFANAQQEGQPDLTYGPPQATSARFVQQPQQQFVQQPQQLQQQQFIQQPQQAQQQQQYFFAPQRFYVAPEARVNTEHESEASSRLTAAKSLKTSARLTANREDLPDDEVDEIATDVDVDVKSQTEQRGIVPAPQPSTVYYPAGAVSFVQPFSATFVQPGQQQPLQQQPVNIATAAAPAPAPAAYIQPFQAQPFSTITTAALVQPTAAKVKVEPAVAVRPAKLTAQPAAFAQPSVYAAPAAFTASPAFYASPNGALTAAPQFYFPSQAQQLQAW